MGLDGPSRTVIVEPVETPAPSTLPERSEPAPEEAPAQPVQPEKVPAGA